MSVQFSTLHTYKVVHAGLLWEKFRKKFPRVEEQPPLQPAFETFGAKSTHQEQSRIEVLSAPPNSRLWFVNKDATQLIQFQPDRFAHNWRKIGEGDTYPRYETIRKEFLSGLRKLRKFAAEESLGTIVPNQVEISYINHISSTGHENLHAQIGKVFNCWNNTRYGAGLGQVEHSRFQTKFIISDNSGIPYARLHASADPVHINGKPSLQFTLMVRGRPPKTTLKAIEKFIDMGRDKIVNGFSDMTTSAMHKRWGKKK